MKKIIFIMILGMLSLFSFTDDFDREIGISAGSETGTYFRFANEIKQSAASEFEIKVYPGGSLINIERILKERLYQFAIVQYDALLYYKNRKNKNLNNLIKMIFPLYDEEIQIIVRQDADIDDILDLKGKRVNVDKENSGSWVTANVIKDKLGLTWKEYNYAPMDALRKLIGGEIDAYIYVAGVPTANLQKFDKKAELAKKHLKLLSFRNKTMDIWYNQITIPEGTYKWQEGSIETYATKAVLVTYNYYIDPDKPRFEFYYDNIYELVKLITENLDELKSTGHAKWKQVDPLDLGRVNWPVHEQALRAVKQLKGLTSEEKELLNLLEEKVDTEKQELLDLLD